MIRRLLGGGVLLASVAALALTMRGTHDVSIGRYATSLDGRTKSQRHNADLALARLNNAVIQPGEVFSFNARVGTFSRDQGYRKAPVSYNGQLIDSWGGGVCQTSTTLYNAALLAGMEILERNRHRFAPSYVPPGRDAAVAFDTIDLKFRNSHPFPVRIAAVDNHGRVEVELRGARPLQHEPQIISEVHRVHAPATFLAGDPGDFGRVRNSGKRGWEVTVFRITAGQREWISSDSYPQMNRIVQAR